MKPKRVLERTGKNQKRKVLSFISFFFEIFSIFLHFFFSHFSLIPSEVNATQCKNQRLCFISRFARLLFTFGKNVAVSPAFPVLLAMHAHIFNDLAVRDPLYVWCSFVSFCLQQTFRFPGNYDVKSHCWRAHTVFHLLFVCVWRVKKFGDSPTIPPFKTLIFISIFRNVCGTFYGTAVELNVLVHLNRHQHIVKSCQASKYLVRKIQQQNEKHREKLCSHISHWFAVQLRIVLPINHSVHVIQIRIQLTLLKSVCCVTSNNRQKSNGPSRFFRAKKPLLLIINQS